MADYQRQHEIEIQNLAFGIQASLLGCALSSTTKRIISQEEKDRILAKAFAKSERILQRETQGQRTLIEEQLDYSITREKRHNYNCAYNNLYRRPRTSLARRSQHKDEQLDYSNIRGESNYHCGYRHLCKKPYYRWTPENQYRKEQLPDHSRTRKERNCNYNCCYNNSFGRSRSSLAESSQHEDEQQDYSSIRGGRNYYCGNKNLYEKPHCWTPENQHREEQLLNHSRTRVNRNSNYNCGYNNSYRRSRTSLVERGQHEDEQPDYSSTQCGRNYQSGFGNLYERPHRGWTPENQHDGELRYLGTEERIARQQDVLKWTRNVQIPEINGSPAVTSRLINDYVNYCSRRNCDSCRRMMQKARLIVTNAPEWCRKNFELTCYAEHFTLVFWSGSRKNKMVVQIADGKIEVAVTEESWRMWLQKVVKNLWSSLKNAAVYCFNKGIEFLKSGGTSLAIGGAVLKAITL